MLVRVLRTGDPAARSEVARTALAALLTPLDVVLTVSEQRQYRQALPPSLPLIFVCGPARSGTSITAQVLIRQLPVSYFSNVVGLFPRSPVTATHMLRQALARRQIGFRTFYGKSQGLAGPNDALPLWDRWFGGVRNAVPEPLGATASDAMVRFFGAWQHAWPAPLVTKNNRLYVYGADVARVLPNAHFICLQRDSTYLAQSQLMARRLLLGRDDVPYGIRTLEYERMSRPDNPVDDACAYVAADRAVVTKTREAIGPSRFWVVSYERFCADPHTLLARLSNEVLGLSFSKLTPGDLAAIQVSARRLVDDDVFARIARTCETLGIADAGQQPYFL